MRVSPDIPPDPDCHRYSHIDTEIVGTELVVSLFFERTGKEFCVVPCPMGSLEPVSAEIRPKPSTRLIPVPHPDTPPHCWEGMPPLDEAPELCAPRLPTSRWLDSGLRRSLCDRDGP